MKHYKIVLIILLIIAVVFSLSLLKKNSKHAANNFETKKSSIEKLFSIKPDYFADENIIKVSFPRTDIKVSIQNYVMEPFMGIATWFSFMPESDKTAMVMGDMVLLEHEVNTAMDAALKNNIHVTALHNHFFFDQPKIYFMHIEGQGPIEELAERSKKVLYSIKSAPPLKPLTIAEKSSLDGATIQKIIGVKGQEKDGMYKVVIGRPTRAECGCMVGKNMGVNTWAAFAGTAENAVMDGDFAVLESELQKVLQALRDTSINVVAIHNHMIGENPRLIFLHFWGNNSVENLARGFKAALDQTATLKESI